MRKNNINKVFEAIKNERIYQDCKHPTIEEREIRIGEWLLILEKELQEAKEAWIKKGDDETLLEILQVISVGVACLEEHGIVERSPTNGR